MTPAQPRKSSLSRSLLVRLAALAVALAACCLVAVKLLPAPKANSYVGSARCESCHRSEHASWTSSLHTKMMRPVREPGVVVADFDPNENAPHFDREDAHWAIGGKWEQQFIGRDSVGETLLPGVWLSPEGRWDFRGWDGWQNPDPVRRCHGCHTVGLDTATGTFVEANIGCESCHGPGEWHAKTFGAGEIQNTASADICGQCHGRGMSNDGEFFFPASYRPGDDLLEHFQFIQPSPGQTSTHWWGNGHPRKRHQEYWSWSQQGHVNSLTHVRDNYDGRYGEESVTCLRCHSGDYILARGTKPTLSEAQFGITCSVCHQAHGPLDEMRVACESCHEGGPFYHEPEKNEGHIPCPVEAKVDCVSCHMPRTAKLGGAYALHTHRSGIISPDAARTWGMPGSCSNGACHPNADPERQQRFFESHYGNQFLSASSPAGAPHLLQ